MAKIKDNSLYLVITEEYGNGRSALEIAKCAVKGGVDLIQMREKKKTAAQLVELGRQLSALCRKNNVTFIVNDDPMLAKEVDADGVHLGQGDMRISSIRETRELLGPDKIIGVSTESAEQAGAMDGEDIDYIAYGPVFSTEIKDKCVGTKDVGRVLRMAKKPVFFIGGITLSNVDELLKSGAKNISLIRGITQADDIMAAVKDFKKKMEIASSRQKAAGRVKQSALRASSQ